MTTADRATDNPQIRPATRHERYSELDSLRGVAAVCVAIGHFAQIVLCAPINVRADWDRWRQLILAANRTPLCFFLNGGQAVRFFFLLSGFVLTLPFLAGTEQPYGMYLVRRIFRIYVPYLGSLFLALVVIQLVAGYHLPGFTGAVQDTWTEKPHLHLVLQHIVMLGEYPCNRYNEVYWSIVQEMRISLLFPFLVPLCLTRSAGWTAGAIVLLSSAAILLAFVPGMSLDLQSYTSTIQFVGIFLAGGWLARYRERISAFLRGRSRTTLVSIGCAAFLMYSVGIKALSGAQFSEHFFEPFFLHHTHLPLAGATFALGVLVDWLAVASSAVAILYALTFPWWRTLLNHPLPAAVGRSSYSLYLVHAIVLYGLLYVLAGRSGMVLFPLLYAAGVCVLTYVFYNAVELPAISAGRAAAKRFRSVLTLRSSGRTSR